MNGKNIIRYRDDNCISQSELAERIGVSKSTLSRWENNKSEPRGEEFKRLREVIGEEYLNNEEAVDVPSKDTLGEMSERVNDILYEVSRIGAKQESLESKELKSELFHKRLRTGIVIATCVFIILLTLGTWIFLMNHGFDGEVIAGNIHVGEASDAD